MNDMEKIAVWGVRWAPPFVAQGLVRDLRVRWALEEAGSDQNGGLRAQHTGHSLRRG